MKTIFGLVISLIALNTQAQTANTTEDTLFVCSIKNAGDAQAKITIHPVDAVVSEYRYYEKWRKDSEWTLYFSTQSRLMFADGQNDTGSVEYYHYTEDGTLVVGMVKISTDYSGNALGTGNYYTALNHGSTSSNYLIYELENCTGTHRLR